MNTDAPNRNKLSYRPEIDGLRAIAVASVILYHAKIIYLGRGWFEGGFIGVDIFFVISGYLITRIILSELYLKGSFSFLNFYERRARRILPILFTVTLVSMPFAWYRLLPDELVEYAQSILSAIFFGSNFYFYFITTEYGAESALLKPLLHTWSLGVEEQFYLVFPLLALVGYRYFGRHLITLLIGLSLISILYAEAMEVENPELNFFLPFSRFWELAVGSVLAILELNGKWKPRPGWSSALSALGFVLAVLPVFYFDDNTPHPGFSTLIPVTGVALIILSCSGDNLVGRILGSRLFVFGGLISYSAYLWHFPIFAFARVRDSLLSNPDKLVFIILTVVLSVLSYYAIERPFRFRLSRRLFFLALTFSALLILVPASYVGFSTNLADKWEDMAPASLTTPYKTVKAGQHIEPRDAGDCAFNLVRAGSVPDVRSELDRCRQKYGRAIFVLGDSHGRNVFNMFRISDQYRFIVGSVQGGCRPHDCDRSHDHYTYFMNHVLPHARTDDLILFHQSGSYLIEDIHGNNDSSTAFATGVFSIDYENINKIRNYLSSVSEKVDARVVWLGPYIEYRQNPKKIIELSRKGKSYEHLLKINENSHKIFGTLEETLKAELTENTFDYVPFASMYSVSRSAVIHDEELGDCFQFADADHFSNCGQIIISKDADYGFVGF